MPLVNNGTKKIPLRLYNSELGFLFIFLFFYFLGFYFPFNHKATKHNGNP